MHLAAVVGDAAGLVGFPNMAFVVGPSALGIGSFTHILKTTIASDQVYHIDSSTRDGRGNREASTRKIVGVDDRLEISFLAQFTHTAWGLMETFGKHWRLGTRERVASNRTSKGGQFSVGY